MLLRIKAMIVKNLEVTLKSKVQFQSFLDEKTVKWGMMTLIDACINIGI